TSIGTGVVEVDIGFLRGGPLLIDFDKDGGDETDEGGLVGEDAYFPGTAFQLLLDRALDGVRSSHGPPMLSGQLEDGEPFGNAVFEPGCKFGGGAAVFGHEPLKLLLRAPKALGIPNGAELFADDLANGLIGSVVDGVLGEVELAALPAGAGQH